MDLQEIRTRIVDANERIESGDVPAGLALLRDVLADEEVPDSLRTQIESIVARYEDEADDDLDDDEEDDDDEEEDDDDDDLDDDDDDDDDLDEEEEEDDDDDELIDRASADPADAGAGFEPVPEPAPATARRGGRRGSDLRRQRVQQALERMPTVIVTTLRGAGQEAEAACFGHKSDAQRYLQQALESGVPEDHIAVYEQEPVHISIKRRIILEDAPV